MRRARAEDSAALCALFRATPMEGAITLRFEREPDFFMGAAVQCDEPEVYVTDDLVACWSSGTRHVFVNGVRERVRYLSDMRVHPDHRNGLLLARGFRHIRRHVMDGDAYAQTVVVADNTRALDLLGSGRAGLPTYHPFGECVTHVFRGGRGLRTDPAFRLRRATAGDVPAMQALFDREAPQRQFYSCYRFDEIGTSPYWRDVRLDDFTLLFDGDALAGLLGTWDQRRFKQTRVVDYSRAIALGRPFHNALAGLRGGVPLPRAGTVLDYRYLHSVVVRDGDPALLRQLLRHVRRSAGTLLATLDTADPLNAAYRGIAARRLLGRHFLVSFGADPRPTLDDRPIHVEAARV